MTIAQIHSVSETPGSILEQEVVPPLDRILLDYGHKLRPHHLDEIRRIVGKVEELVYELESAFDNE